eukprot:TRINITY_DN28628_c0_g1_i2.p1 TRINITY_DN28628_c0_g1~~TRINITY_DN28628_c0_g1_i2.p1  ORF type:complete len:460 (-),score=111.58 TRINITY_DN28628_c0_g1_i2:384-1763(-)
MTQSRYHFLEIIAHELLRLKKQVDHALAAKQRLRRADLESICLRVAEFILERVKPEMSKERGVLWQEYSDLLQKVFKADYVTMSKFEKQAVIPDLVEEHLLETLSRLGRYTLDRFEEVKQGHGYLQDEEQKAAAEKAKADERTWKRMASKTAAGQFYYMEEKTGFTQSTPPTVDLPWEIVKVQDKKTGTAVQFCYVNRETRASQVDPPPGARPEAAVAAGASLENWRKLASKSNPGKFYYYNTVTCETRAEPPEGFFDSGAGTHGTWKWKESPTMPGVFFYHNLTTATVVKEPPRVELPWRLMPSNTKAGHFYYYNEKTGESTVNPPPSARAPVIKQEDDAEWERVESKSAPGQFFFINHATGTVTIDRPHGALIVNDEELEWERMESTSRPGRYYYQNVASKETVLEPPPIEAPWELKESTSKPGQWYYHNTETGETTVHPPAKRRRLTLSGLRSGKG